MKRPAQIQEKVILAPLTTYRIGGPARFYARPKSVAELQQILRWAQEEGWPLFVLGAGSNVLVSDRGFDGVILHLQGFRGELREPGKEGIWEVGSGTMLMHWVRRSISRGFSGAEALIGIPGTVGGALRMNAGAFAVEIGQLLVNAEIIYLPADRTTATYELKTVAPETARFGYREAPGLENTVILSARFKLTPGDKEKILKQVREAIAMRRNQQPLKWPSCGSVFKRPPGDFAGRLIEVSGLKGLTYGGAQISSKHANFITNLGHATADDVLTLIKMVKNRVWEEQGVRLEREVILIGFDEAELEGA